MAAVQQAADRRLRRDATVDLAVLERGNERRARSDREPRELIRLHAITDPEVAHLEVRRRAGAGDAHDLALDVGKRLDRAVCRHQDRVTRGEADLHDTLGRLALAGEVDRVVVVAHRRVDLPGDERVRFLDACG